jgi:TctA family transporter
MDTLHNLSLGFGVALTFNNLAFCLIGCILGTLIGVLPGIGPAATVAMLLPITFTMEPTTALIMLSGIYYGAQYGGSTTAILVNVPGEASSVVTALDGHEMARAGRAGVALGAAAISSFVAGTIATVLIAAFGPALSSVALSFGAPEFFSLMVLGLVASVVLAHGSLLKALCMVVLGLILGIVGTDVTSGVERFTFGARALSEGVNVAAVAMGLFGLAEIMRNLEHSQSRKTLEMKIEKLIPRLSDLRLMLAPILRGTAIGSVLGILPGGGALLSSFASYAIEKKIAKDSSRFGKGAIEGVAGPEAANNAGAQTSFIPMLTLGIPSNAVMAMMIGAMMIQGIQPGPRTIVDQPGLFWGLVASMWIGNLMLLVLNLPLVGLWVKLLRIPYRWLFPSIIVFCAVGAYTLNNRLFDIYVVVFFGFVGYLFSKLGYELAPLILAAVLGSMMEENLRRSLILSGGNVSIFVERPISALLLVASCIAIGLVALPRLRKQREVIFEEEA